MNARVVRLLMVLAVLALVVFIAMNTHFEETTVPVPLRGEALRNPFYAAIRFSEALGAEASWERVFAEPRSDSVIVLSSWNWTLSRPRRQRIEHWVESGGRLIIDDTLIGGFDEFRNWSGISEQRSKRAGKLKKNEDQEDDEAAEKTDETGDAQESSEADDDAAENFFDAMNGKQCEELTEDGTGHRINVCGVNEHRALTTTRKILWALRDKDQKIHALRTAVGRGSVTVIDSSPFQHRDFLRGEHPLLFATMTQLHHGDLVSFLTEEDQASIVSLMWRFGAPAVLLLLGCVALALWRAGPRFGPPVAATPSARRSLAEQIRGTGQFALRFGGGRALHSAAVRALRDVAIRRFPRFDRMSSEERVETIAKASGMSADELGPAMNNTGLRSSHELRQSIAVLETARRRLLAKAQHGN